jgi:tetratricopeptide (TPR) repeat protein
VTSLSPRIPRLFTTLVLLMPACAAFAVPDAAERASAAYQAKDWNATEAAAREMLRGDAKSAKAHFFLAVALMHEDGSLKALDHLQRAAELGYPAFAVEYRRACADAALGRSDEAFAALDRAVAGGFARAALLESEPLLAGLREDPRFDKILAAIEKAQHPCRNDPRYRAFDFWLGTWDVRPRGAPESDPPSENVVTLEYDGCVVMEHWSGRGGVTGSSFNIFDASRDEWSQTWVDSSGALHEYHGNPDSAGNMILEGTTPGGPGQPKRIPTRLSFFRLGPDKVRQFSESTTDGGKTWVPNYDLIYLRRPGTPRP